MAMYFGLGTDYTKLEKELRSENKLLKKQIKEQTELNKKLTKQLSIPRVVKSLPSSEYIWIQGRSESDRRVFIKWFEQYR